MLFDLVRLRHVVALASQRSFTRAAEQLHISQPALSRSISEFERRAGVRLFERNRGGIELTAVGRQVVAQAEDLLRSAEAIDLNLKLYAKGEGGSVSIGLGPLFASLVLPSLSRHLLRTWPFLELRTIILPPDHLLDDLLENRIEAIFGSRVPLEGVMPHLEVVQLGEIRMDLLVRAAHPLARRRDLVTKDLQHFPAATTMTLRSFGNLRSAAGLVCDNFEILRDLTLDTDCVWLASADLVREHVAEGRLVRLSVKDYTPPTGDLSLIWRRGRTLSPALLGIADYIRSTCVGTGLKP